MNQHKNPTYYHTCPVCGANLDPGEQCDCERSIDSLEDTSREAA